MKLEMDKWPSDVMHIIIIPPLLFRLKKNFGQGNLYQNLTLTFFYDFLSSVYICLK